MLYQKFAAWLHFIYSITPMWHINSLLVYFVNKRMHENRVVSKLGVRFASFFDRGLTQLRRDVLHWLNITDRITFRLCVHVFLCLHGTAPSYLSEHCRLVSEFEGRRHLRSSGHSQLDVPRYRLATIGRRVFGYVGPKTWNSLPDYLRCSDLSFETFKRQLTTFLFAHYQRI